MSPSKVGFRPLLIWIFGASFYFYQFFFRVSPSVMTDDLMETFGIQSYALGILSSFYYFAYAAMQIPIGMMLDLYGPRRLLTLSCCLCTLGGLVFASSMGIGTASLGRLLMGAGSACAFIGTLKLATLWFPLRHIGLAAGFTMFLGFLGATSAGAPLAILIDHVGWRSALYIVAIIGVFLSLGIWIFVRDRENHHVDELNNIQDQTILSRAIINLRTVVVNQQVWLLAFYGSLMYVPLSAFADLWGIPYITRLYEIDKELAASQTSMIFMGAALGGPVMTWLSDYLKKRKTPMMIGAAAITLLYSIVIYFPNIPFPLMYVLLFFAGFLFTGQVLCFASVCEIIPLSASGVAVGFTNMVVMISGVIFEPLIGWILQKLWNGQMYNGAPIYSVENFKIALITVPLSTLVAVILLRFIQETHPQSLRAK